MKTKIVKDFIINCYLPIFILSLLVLINCGELRDAGYSNNCMASECHLSTILERSKPITGKHEVHLAYLKKDNPCDLCHEGYLKNVNHKNGVLDARKKVIVKFDKNNPATQWDLLDGSCADIGCHNGSAPGKNTARDAAARAAVKTYWYGSGTGCTACHTLGSSIDPMTTNGSGISGKHIAHVTNKEIDCEVCHKDYKTKPIHMNGIAEVDQIVYVGGTFNGVPVTFTYNTNDTCGSISCHGGTGGISWYMAGSGCNICHDTLNPGNSNAGSHPAHFGGGLIDTGGGNPAYSYGDTKIYKDYSGLGSLKNYMFSCGNCHPLDPSKHMNGQLEVELYNAVALPTTIKGMNPSTAQYNSGAKTCADAYCHSTGQTASVRTYKATPAWGSPFANTLADPKCNKCHDNPPRYASVGEGADSANTHLVMGDDDWELGHFGGMPGPWHTSYHGSWSGWGPDYANHLRVAAPMTCQTCHYDTVDSTNTGPSGYYYLDTTGNYIISGGSLGYTCGNTNCHDGGTNNAIAPRQTGKAYPLKHVNGTRDVDFDPRTGQSPLPAVYPGYDTVTINGPLWVNAIPSLLPPDSISNGGIWSMNLSNSTYDNATKTCNNIPCHINESYNKPYIYPPPDVFPPLKWGRVPVGYATCNNCHWY